MKELIISENKVLRDDEKSRLDTLQLTQVISSDTSNALISMYSKEDVSNLQHITNIYPDKGKVLYLEVVVEDSLLASLLYEWLFDKSKFDGNNLHALGCSLKTIHYEMPSGYTPEEKAAIRTLNTKANGQTY